MVHRACGPRSLSRKAPTSIGPCITYTRMEGLTHFQVMDGARGVLAGIDRHLRQISLRLTTRLYRRERRVSGVAKNTTPPYTSLYLCSSHTLTHILPHSLSLSHVTHDTLYSILQYPIAAQSTGCSCSWPERKLAEQGNGLCRLGLRRLMACAAQGGKQKRGSGWCGVRAHVPRGHVRLVIVPRHPIRLDSLGGRVDPS